jgi:hypothetical protein
MHKGSLASKSHALQFSTCGILECAHFIILVCSTCAHYTMEGACKNDRKQLTKLGTFVFTFTIGVQTRGITVKKTNTKPK